MLLERPGHHPELLGLGIPGAWGLQGRCCKPILWERSPAVGEAVSLITNKRFLFLNEQSVFHLRLNSVFCFLGLMGPEVQCLVKGRHPLLTFLPVMSSQAENLGAWASGFPLGNQGRGVLEAAIMRK
jgi:hypothetical protein